MSSISSSTKEKAKPKTHQESLAQKKIFNRCEVRMQSVRKTIKLTDKQQQKVTHTE